MFGPLTLLALAAGLLVLVGTAVLIWAMHLPKRQTVGVALARGMATDPAELGLQYSTERFRFRDGTSTPGWVIEGEDPQGPIVVMTHGWRSGRYRMLRLVPLMAPFASRVVVYDMRGHGESTATISRLGTTEADDLVELIDQLEAAGRPVVLFGSSMGAGVSIVAAAKQAGGDGSVCAGVIADGPYRHYLEPIMSHLRRENWPVFPFNLIVHFHLLFIVRGFWGFDRVRHAARLDCPLVVLHGTEDPICRVESGRQIAQAAARGWFVPFRGGGHGNLVDLDRQRYQNALADGFDAIREAACSDKMSGSSGPSQTGFQSRLRFNQTSPTWPRRSTTRF